MGQTFGQIQFEIATMLDIPDDVLTEDQRKKMDTYLDELAVAERTKVDGFGQFVRLQTARVEACKEESKRLAAKAKAAEKRIAWLKMKYLASMQANGVKEIKGDAYTISIRKSEAVAVTAMVDTLPVEYQRKKIIVEPDKTAIKDALKRGLEIPGCSLGDTFSLNIR